jgi:ABC-type polysaccharide/polyol phosphate transport system ATPase subunit
MSDHFAISVENVSKAYRIWDAPASRLTSPMQEKAAELFPAGSRARHWLQARSARQYRDFWALKDISFALRKGESLGIIGRNGSGKSTLLQIIAGTLQPTTGTVRVNGRIAALLELGSGFNPEFTGRENVFLNGAVLGLTKKEVESRFDQIAAFADIGDFIEQPVKTYSSGMTVRLAFAVAAHVDPDLLIIDEALSVGDARFQLKCARAIDRFIEQGVTLLFVSHDVSSVKRLCKSAILLECGDLVYQGRPNPVVNLYSKLTAEGNTFASIENDLELLRNEAQANGATPDAQPSTRPTQAIAAPHETPAGFDQNAANKVAELQLKIKAMELAVRSREDGEVIEAKVNALMADERLHKQITGAEFSYGGDLGRIIHLEVQDTEGQPRTWFDTGEPVAVRMEVESLEYFTDPIFALTLKNAAGVEVYGTNTFFAKQPARPISPGERRTLSFNFDFNVMPGHYFLSFGFVHFFGEKLQVIHRRYDAIKIEVHAVDRTFGIANLRAQIGEVPSPSARVTP